MGTKGCSRKLIIKRRTSGSTRRESVRLKVNKLQKLIPGGKGLEADRLLLRTASYILHLRLQVDALEALLQIYKTP